MDPQSQQIQIKAQDDDLKGYYVNAMAMSYNPEEFFLDFLMVHPPSGQLVSRIITSPGHIKRFAAAVNDQIKKYEAAYGKIKAADEPKTDNIGFQVS